MSAWIDFIRGRPDGQTDRQRQALDRGAAASITPMIYQEIHQGAADERYFRDDRSYFSSQPFLHPIDPVATHERAARIHFECRRRGLTIRSSNDCLIAQIAVEHDTPLLHDDRDFDRIAAVVPTLKLA